jgi:3-deoxy-D-manno-octulosonic-acid transferase
MTASGLEIAKVNLPDLSAHFLVPFDLPSAASRAMKQIHPDLFITIETEIWPNLVKYAKQNGAQVLMVNGRLSIRSIGQYQKYKRFFKKVLSFYDKFCMINQVDAERIKALGADPNKVSVNGNIKFDRLAKETNPEFRTEMVEKLHLTGNEPILVAGSTREGEEELILEAYTQIKTKYPDLLLLIAPRHIQRGDEVAGIVRNHGFQPLLRTEITSNSRISPETVIILNTIGELFKVYSLASLTFCGASLVPLGGQNPLEPAAWGKVVLYGPSMEDFLDAKQFLEEAGSGIQVVSATDLAEKAVELLADPGRLTSLGNAGQMLIRAQQGSSLRSLELIISSIGGKSNGD